MELNRQDSRCNSRGRHGMDMPNKFTDQFDGSTIKSAHSPCEDESIQNVQKAECAGNVREVDTDSAPSGSLASPNSKKALSKQVSLGKIRPNACSIKSERDEQEIKKEDASLSPISPSEFVSGSGSIINQSNCGNNDNSGHIAPNKINSPLSNDKNTQLEERPKSASQDSCGILANASIRPKSQDSFISNIAKNLNAFNGNITKFSKQGENNGMFSSGSGVATEYLQQQNHVFVFSTQLANKSAEAVITGQYPTIIAYHCMQPSTKLFLEDFLKNPAKASKIQKQYSMNIMNFMHSGSSSSSVAQQSYWINDSNKLSHRSALRNVVNKTNQGWDGALEQGCSTQNPMENLNNSENYDNKSGPCDIKVEDKTNVPSLQGVKVPDENLTPQQRQHREEQLAKLKKMNKFLFPENDGSEFQTGQGSNLVHHPSESISAANCSDQSKMFPPAMRNALGNSGKCQGNSSIEGAPGLATDLMVTGGGCIQKISNSNMTKSRGSSDMNSETISSIIENNTEIGQSFNMDNCSSSETENVSRAMNINMTQEEWVKFESNPFQDNFKNRLLNSGQHPGTVGNNSMNCQQNSPISRSLSMGGSGYSMPPKSSAGPIPNSRNNSGPPPPYNQTQRSASVPIATESPTNVNTNTDISLPSPQGPRVSFGSLTPPNTEVVNSSATITHPTHSTPTVLSGISSGTNMNSLMHNMNSNTLPHLSPREIDCKTSSPHKYKGPLINDMPDNICMDQKYSNFGLNYSACGLPPIGRQNIQQMTSQFCRRIDNIPLNPNCNRIGQNKNTSGFDPISSLAQMSQQLTGCGMGLNSIGGGGGSLVDSGELMSHTSRASDHSIDHCNQMSNANHVGMVGPPGSRSNQFPSDINNMLCGDSGPIDQRMLNGGKMCLPNMPGNYNANSMGGVGCNDIISGNRPLNRRMLPSNFDNFNISPNIHVKMNAPNTIQYMPARSQNINNMRVHPGIEFFQRYSNPQIMGNINTGHGLNEMPNSNMINMFGNCNQIPPTGIGGFETPNDLDLEANLMPNDDYMNAR
uniref:B-cell lymphoma 9 beta-catenin binding domain-containing protein n=1 Tax=Stomoxys calcitrans TaxID=35570 RepID=A0A1I8Q0S1_STOCA